MTGERHIYHDLEPIPPENAEGQPPLDIAMLQSVHERMRQITLDEIQAVKASREAGAPHRLLTHLLSEPEATNLTAGHIHDGRITSPGAVLMQQAGLIYGMIACNDYRMKVFGERLQADDPDAYERALAIAGGASYGMHYRAFQFTAEEEGRTVPRWWVERYREQEYTSTDAFTILTALVHPHAEKLTEGMAPAIPTDESMEALQTGFVDARIFLKYYGAARNKQHIGPRYRFNKQSAAPISFGDEPFSLTAEDTVETAVAKIRPSTSEVAWYDLKVSEFYPRALTLAQVVQVGPNRFQKMHRILDSEPPQQPIEASAEEREFLKAMWMHWSLPQLSDKGVTARPSEDVTVKEQEIRDMVAVTACRRIISSYPD